MEIHHIHAILDKLYIRDEFPGYEYLSYAIYLAVQRVRELPPPLNTLYGRVAEHYHVSVSCVEHHILKTLKRCWNRETADRFHKIVGYPVREQITAKEFIFVLAEFMDRKN